MMKPIFILSILVVLYSCTRPEKKALENNHKTNEVALALEYIFKQDKEIPKDFYEQPLQIKKNSLVPGLNDSLLVNGRKCILLPDTIDVTRKLRGMDIFKPYPIVEIIKYNSTGNKTEITVILRTIGNVYDITIDNSIRAKIVGFQMYQI